MLPPDVAVDAPAPTCMGYMVVGTSKYRYVTTAVDWVVAEMDCEDDEPGATHLSIVDTATELDDVTASASDDVWIGLVDRKLEGTWVWVDGNSHLISTPPWKAGEPSTGANDDCAMIKAGQFEAANCTDNKQYVCECDGVAPNPGTYEQ